MAFKVLPGRPRRLSTRAHLALFAAAFALPMLVFAAVLLWKYGEGERTRLEQAAVQEARDIAQAVDGELGDLLTSAQILALTPAVRKDRFEEIHELVSTMYRTLGVIAVLRSPDGQQVVSPLKPYGESLPKVQLASDQTVLKTGEPAFSDLFTGGVSRAYLFAATVPVKRQSGEIAYLLNLSFPVDRLRNMIAREEPPANWTVAIVDRGGVIMARNNRHEAFVGQPATPDLQENTRGREGSWTGFTADGQPVFAAYARSHLSDWRVAVGVRRADLAEPLQRSIWWLIVMGSGLFAMSTLLASYFGQRITNPIKALAGQADALGRGEPVEPVATGVTEIAQVGEALTVAAASLRSRREALLASEERLRLAIDAGRMGVWEVHVSSGRLIGSPELNQLFGFPPDANPTLDEFRSRYYPGERERMQATLQRALASDSRYAEVEFRCVWPDGQIRWLLLRGQIHLNDGSPSKIVGVVLDITERKRWEEQQRLLVNELNHRVKNTLATVQSIASQTLRNAASTEEARGAMEERLFALSRAHDVLTRESWEGAGLRELVDQALAPYRHERENRLGIAGPDIRLSPRMALALAMALQELATNAVKFGALSNTTGEIAITWRVESEGGRAPQLSLIWRETGGPVVVQPSRRGFGTRLIERSLAQDLGGHVTIDFAATGLVCRVEAPIRTNDEA